MPPLYLQLLALALQTAPAVVSEIEQALNDHWGKDHVQQIAKGAQLLQTVAATVGSVVAQNTTPVMPTAGNPTAQPPMDTAGHNES